MSENTGPKNLKDFKIKINDKQEKYGVGWDDGYNTALKNVEFLIQDIRDEQEEALGINANETNTWKVLNSIIGVEREWNFKTKKWEDKKPLRGADTDE